MLQLSSSNGQSKGMAFPHPGRGRRRAAWLVAGAAVVLAVAGGIWAALHTGTGQVKTVRLDISGPPPPLPALKQGFLQIDPAKAELVNAGIALSTAPIERARPFKLPAVTVTNLISHQSAVDCLTAAVYYEAASESTTGQRAVAQVVLNRVRHPAFPKSVCGVVYEGSERSTGCQFSFTCDGSLARQPSQAGWDRARLIAQAALAGYVEPSVGTATHYHTTGVVPYWAWSLDKITVVGAHIFYRWKGYWGRRAAFNGVYAGEPTPDETAFILPDPIDQAASTAAPTAPTGPRPIADDLDALPAGTAISAHPTVRPLADQQNGSLKADEHVGAIGSK